LYKAGEETTKRREKEEKHGEPELLHGQGENVGRVRGWLKGKKVKHLIRTFITTEFREGDQPGKKPQKVAWVSVKQPRYCIAQI